MTGKTETSWGAMFTGGRRLATVTLAGGVGLQAIEAFIGSTLLPSVVSEIGGLELFAWNATVFIVASIAASIFAAVRPFGVGPRGVYVFAAAGFGLGSLICGLAPNIEVFLLGRAVQGFGAGLLTAIGYSMIRLIFPPSLWGSAFGLISSIWGISTLIGPAIGGIFAAYDAWRLAFFVLVPCAVLLATLAVRVLPRSSGEAGMRTFPVLQIALVIGAVAAISVASILTEGILLPSFLIALAILLIVALKRVDGRRAVRLFPTGSFTWGTSLAALFGAMMLLNSAIITDMFVPLFLQRLHGQAPLIAGYMVALTAVGWSTGSMLVSNWTGARERVVLVLGPTLQLVGVAGLLLFMGRDNTGGAVLPLLPIGVSLLLLGAGIGIAWPHIEARLLHAAPPGEANLTAAAMSMAQLFASGFSAAVAGVVVNAAGLASGDGIAATISAANWLYGLFALVPLVAIPIAWSLSQRDRIPVHQAAE